MDMMPPICPWARRCIQMKKTINSPIGMSSGRIDAQMLASGVSNLTPFSENRLASSSGSGVGPVVLTLLPSLSSPLMLPFVLL